MEIEWMMAGSRCRGRSSAFMSRLQLASHCLRSCAGEHDIGTHEHSRIRLDKLY